MNSMDERVFDVYCRRIQRCEAKASKAIKELLLGDFLKHYEKILNDCMNEIKTINLPVPDDILVEMFDSEKVFHISHLENDLSAAKRLSDPAICSLGKFLEGSEEELDPELKQYIAINEAEMRRRS